MVEKFGVDKTGGWSLGLKKNGVWNVLQPFYSLTIVWSIVWFFYVTDDPVNHGSITSEEKTYILENRGPTSVSGQASDGEIRQKMMKKTPFKTMILTPMVWVIMICEFANIWGILVMINEGPNFIDKILKRSISGVSKIFIFSFFQFVKRYKYILIIRKFVNSWKLFCEKLNHQVKAAKNINLYYTALTFILNFVICFFNLIPLNRLLG